MPATPFKTAFCDVPLDASLFNALASAEVSDLRINRQTRTLSMHIDMAEIIDEAYLPALAEGLKKHFKIVDSVKLTHRYHLNEPDVFKSIQQYRANLIHAVESHSPVCKMILEKSKWSQEGELLIIDIPANSAFLFMRRGIDREMERLLTERLQTRVQIRFREAKPQPRNDNAYELRYAKAAAASRNVQALGESTEKPKRPKAEPKPNGANGFAGKRRGGGFRQPRVNPELEGVVTRLSEDLEQNDDYMFEGVIFALEIRQTRSGKYLITFDMTDGTSSITVKLFLPKEVYEEKDNDFVKLLQKGNGVRVAGRVQYDAYANEINVMADELGPYTPKANGREDKAERKRVELHLHTNMSQMDAINPVGAYIKRAKEWGHTAIAVTDHGVVQAFPDAMDAAKKHGVKVLYGVEAYLVDDLGLAVTANENEHLLDDECVVFDLETTGFSPEKCKIIEIGAVKLRGGEIIDRFSAFVNPKETLPAKIIELTKITDDMLREAEEIEAVMPRFLAFIGDAFLVAHNMPFDGEFLRSWARKCGRSTDGAVTLCTLALSRALFNNLARHSLDAMARHLKITLNGHHRAVNDAEATAQIYLKCVEMLKGRGVTVLSALNEIARADVDVKKLKYYHAIVLVKNKAGLRNLYELVSKAHIEHFNRQPRMMKSEIQKLREGLILGSACEAGELFTAIIDGRSEETIKRIADFYDYLEIQPIGNNMFLHRQGKAESIEMLKDWNRQIVAYGEQWSKPVVATCDVHFLNPEDEVYRRIIMAGSGFEDADLQAPLFYRTTEEMLAEFDYLGAQKAYEVVVENTNRIADEIESIKPIPDGTYPPKIPGAEDEIKKIAMTKAYETYGDPLPKTVEDRLERELGSIIKNGFSVMYIIAQKLVWNSVENGYIVGSRGSVGSSFVATMTGISEVNPLPPHYLCTACKYSDFDSPEVRAFAGASGCDMPKKACPVCGQPLSGEGHDIPFETFLGFDGDKEPDIDLNFSGEYQAKAHAYTEEIFGKGFVFKAGTIGTLAEKTAYGYVVKYLEERGRTARKAEINRLATGCNGIKKSTGQHPGGMMVLPNDRSIYEFCPIQYPADKTGADFITTHFDYHSISGRLLKLDILGHDAPTIIRMLLDMTGIDPCTVDLSDPATMSLFTSPDAMGVTKQQIKCETGTLGLPEFGTHFVRQMLLETKPSSFAELVRISGLSHGTDVWTNNAQELVKNGTATLKEIIPTRDDIMVYLINKGMEKLAAFKIMENVRKGKGVTEAEETAMRAADVPDWYIESCRRIKYMFPKGHAVAYVMMTVRIGYFKLYHPAAFYAASFSVKAGDFDYAVMCRGKEIVAAEMKRISDLGDAVSGKEKSTIPILELVYEMYARGLYFAPLDIYTATANKFRLTDKGLMPPLCAVQGLGETAAQSIVEARKDGEFLSMDDFRIRAKVTKTVVELLRSLDLLAGMPESNQVSLFG